MEYTYIAVFDDGTARLMKREPSDDELKDVEGGTLTILRFKTPTPPILLEQAVVEVTNEVPEDDPEGEEEEIITTEWERL